MEKVDASQQIDASKLPLYTPEQALQRPDMWPHGTEMFRVRGIPSHPFLPGTEHFTRGMGFRMGELYCALSEESFRRAGYSSADKVPLMQVVIDRLRKNRVPLTVVGNYRGDRKILEVDYGLSIPYIERAIDKLLRK